MKNIEKYKDVLLNSETNDLTCCVIDLFHKGKCPDSCKVCKQRAIECLLSEYKEPVLDDGETLCQLPRFPLSSEMYKGWIARNGIVCRS